MKRLVHTVDLTLFEDENSAMWGLTHKNTHNENTPFDAIWNGQMIFHDIFEHWFENEHKYFRGSNAMNVGGEMSAMGAMWYYYAELGVYNRLQSGSMYSPGDSMKLTTLGMVQDSIQEGHENFGSLLECGVPYQRPIDNGELEYQIADYAEKVKGYSTDSWDVEFSKNYKNSVNFNKIASLHRWGYKMAERLVNDNHENQRTLTEFLEFWDDFTNNVDAEELAPYFNGITFKIYKDKGVISWKAILNGCFNGYNTTEDYIITSEQDYTPCLETILSESLEEEEY